MPKWSEIETPIRPPIWPARIDAWLDTPLTEFYIEYLVELIAREGLIMDSGPASNRIYTYLAIKPYMLDRYRFALLDVDEIWLDFNRGTMAAEMKANADAAQVHARPLFVPFAVRDDHATNPTTQPTTHGKID